VGAKQRDTPSFAKSNKGFPLLNCSLLSEENIQQITAIYWVEESAEEYRFTYPISPDFIWVLGNKYLYTKSRFFFI
jgi:hypothetical protein